LWEGEGEGSEAGPPEFVRIWLKRERSLCLISGSSLRKSSNKSLGKKITREANKKSGPFRKKSRKIRGNTSIKLRGKYLRSFTREGFDLIVLAKYTAVSSKSAGTHKNLKIALKADTVLSEFGWCDLKSRMDLKALMKKPGGIPGKK
jgi:hypothetical protein